MNVFVAHYQYRLEFVLEVFEQILRLKNAQTVQRHSVSQLTFHHAHAKMDMQIQLVQKRLSAAAVVVTLYFHRFIVYSLFQW